MLLLGGAATTEALTGIDYRLASFLIPWGVILYTAAGGLKATFISTYFHTVLIFAVLIIMVFIVYIKVYSSDQIYKFLDTVANFSEEDCAFLYQNGTDSFYEKSKYACGYVSGNNQGSYLTMLSSGGLMFGIINIVGNFGTVFVDNSYWQSAIAARPDAAAVGYLLGGLCWFAVPFSLATSLGLSSVALMLPVTATEAGDGLVPPAVAVHLLGDAGAALILIMLFMAITSTGSAESIAVSSLVAYDIYREYINPDATGADILRVSRYIIVIFGLFSGCFALLLHEIGLNLGWVYLFMGIIIGPAVFPLWFMMTWKGASGTGAILAAWGGLILAVISWLVGAQIQGGKITVDTLGTNEVMLSGNLVAILSSGFIHWFWSVFVDKTDYDFNELDKNIRLVENDTSGMTAEDLNPEELDKVYKWITRRGYVISFILIFVWPVLSIPAGKFTESYFAFWVLVSIAWGFAGGIVVTILPITESFDEIGDVFVGMYNAAVGKPIVSSAGEVVSSKEIDEKPDPVVSPAEEEIDA
jgi:urea-proton symporter